MFSGASTIAGKIDAVFLFILIICIALLVLITFLMIFFVIKYSRKRNQKPENIHGNTWLEVTWTVIPTILVLGMFYWGWIVYSYSRDVPENAMVVKVTGRMWSWLFEYANGVQTDSLYVPVDKPVKLELHSQDVIHSFFVPAFRIKEDLVPGLNNYQWFQATEVGKYDVLCAEYCGLQHSYMLTSVNVMSEADFQKWMQQQVAKVQEGKTSSPVDSGQGGALPAVASLEAKGKRLLSIKGCVACHSQDGSESVGPSFRGIFGAKITVITGGKEREIVADEEYLRKSMTNPSADLSKGFQNLMPPQQDQITEAEMDAIIAYLKQLK